MQPRHYNQNQGIKRWLQPKHVAIVVVVIMVGWLMLGTLFTNEANVTEQTNAPSDTHAVQLPKVKVTSLQATQRSENFVTHGTTEVKRHVLVKSNAQGKIVNIAVKAGQKVEQGALLVALDVADYDARVSQASANLELRKLEHKVAKSLANSGYKSETNLAQAVSQLEQAKAELVFAKKQLQDRSITSPFSGVVEEVFVELGDHIKAVDHSLVSLIDDAVLLVTIYVPETRIDHIEVGMAATIKLANGTQVEGMVAFTGREGDEDTRTFRVEVQSVNFVPNGRHGMSASVVIPLNQALMHRIPPSATTLGESGDIGVKHLIDGDKVAFTPITIIEEDQEGYYWVVGLPDKIRLIGLGAAYVKAGQTVHPIYK